MVNIVEEFEKTQLKTLGEGKKEAPEFKAGDTVRVNYRIREGKNERVQAFEGVCIQRRNGYKYNGTFKVRKMSGDIGVERNFPVHSPLIESIQVIKVGDVRRAKLYYLRDRKGKSARIKELKDYKKSETK